MTVEVILEHIDTESDIPYVDTESDSQTSRPELHKASDEEERKDHDEVQRSDIETMIDDTQDLIDND